MDSDLSRRPYTLSVALAVSVLSIFLGFVGLAFGDLPRIGISDSSFRILVAVSLGTSLALLYCISQGRNWARWTFIVLTVISLPDQAEAFWLYRNDLPSLLQLGQGLFSIVLLIVTMFLRESRAWFREAKSRRPAV
jgi:hypothetical protein